MGLHIEGVEGDWWGSEKLLGLEMSPGVLQGSLKAGEKSFGKAKEAAEGDNRSAGQVDVMEELEGKLEADAREEVE